MTTAANTSPSFRLVDHDMYVAHQSAQLKELFLQKPYQGVPPSEAQFLFVGLDANYEATIAASPIFNSVLEYHEDAVSFWRSHQVHHPFLLPGYSGDGYLYHRSFANIGFGPEHADQVSFVELLDVPTVGRNVLTVHDLSESHLRMINTAILNGRASHIFVSATVRRLMRESLMFSWLPRSPKDDSGPLGVFFEDSHRTVYSHLHFSVYGKFAARKATQADAIRDLITATKS